MDVMRPVRQRFGHRRAGLHVLVLVAGAMGLAGCQMTLTDRYEVAKDGSVKVRLIETLDDQMASLMASQGSTSWENPFNASPAGPWAVTRTLDAWGKHEVETTRTFPSYREVGPALRALASQATIGATGQSLALDALTSDVRLTFATTPGLFQSDQHVHVDIPAILKPGTEQLFAPYRTRPGFRFGNAMPSPARIFAAAGSALAVSTLSVRTEIALPYKVLQTNGERLHDGSYRWMHPLRNSSTIDLTVEAPDTTNIAIAGFMGAIFLLGLAAAGIAALRKHASGRPQEVPA
jgi:hypothetical protein